MRAVALTFTDTQGRDTLYRMATMTEMIHVRIDRKTKRSAEKALKAMGISATGAVRALYSRIAADHALPFALYGPQADRDERVLRSIIAPDGVSLWDTLHNRTKEQRLSAVRAYMATQPFPHYEGVPGKNRLMVRIDADGTRTVGRFVNKVFRTVKNP